MLNAFGFVCTILMFSCAVNPVYGPDIQIKGVVVKPTQANTAGIVMLKSSLILVMLKRRRVTHDAF